MKTFMQSGNRSDETKNMEAIEIVTAPIRALVSVLQEIPFLATGSKTSTLIF